MTNDFEDPTGEEQVNDEGFSEEAESQWEEPGDEDAGEFEEALVAALDGAAHEFDTGLLESLARVEQSLQKTCQASEAHPVAENAYEGAGNIVGVGLGDGEDDSAGGDPGEPCLNLYVAEPCSCDEIRAVLVDSMGVAAEAADNLPVNVVVTGVIDALSHRFRMRPAPGGVSCGHVRITAGTIGCLARGRRAPRNRRLMILSNNHVIANSNSARFGDRIVQPGPADGGRSRRDDIAILERFVPINFSGRTNYVDCATGWAWPTRVRRELVYLRSGVRRLFRISSSIAGCRRGMLVGKSGRTTQLTVGRVTDCSATIRVNYGGGRIALFRDQIAIRGLRGNFSAGGDSGSSIWTWDGRRNPVGLLFAGGGGVTFANKMTRVVRALDINLYT